MTLILTISLFTKVILFNKTIDINTNMFCINYPEPIKRLLKIKVGQQIFCQIKALKS